MGSAGRQVISSRDRTGVRDGSREVSLAAKVAFLAIPRAYGRVASSIGCRETHVSWLFSTPDEVYNLKKPVRFAYLDFSSLEHRRVACSAELALNRRLAPDVYKRLAPLTRTALRWRSVALARSSTGWSSCAAWTTTARWNACSWPAA